MTFKNYYKILEVSSQASTTEIKRSYRTLAKTWHPDKNDTLEAKHRFRCINEAYQTLSHPTKRHTYDLYYWSQIRFSQELQAFQQAIEQTMQEAQQKRQTAHKLWMQNFEAMWASSLNMSK